MRYLALFTLFAALSLAAADGYRFMTLPPEREGREKIVTIAKGESVRTIARRLENENILRSDWRFRILIRFNKMQGSVQAGEFALRTDLSPYEVLRKLTSGQGVLYRLQIIEGSTWWQIRDKAEATGLVTGESVESAIRDPELLARFQIPHATAEGFLFPETYHVSRPRNKNGRGLVVLFLETFQRQTRDLDWEAPLPVPLTRPEIITLASLVEKETGRADERARIAGVYLNRLKRGMLLQCDPTIIYGLGPEFNGNLTRKNLRDSSNPYNTYRHKGLPPGPICSPGLASIKAVLHPEEHEFLFFVSTGDGSHIFNTTLRGHNRAVRRYQLR
ncbi:MAG TPA: endolytic transglycosylase MltG [Desulfomicrobiaceae bacterium]|nr:endolytic transglycosylase MltG [Desulfomicrobiaceae bacterium]